jgi:4-amino-4-deoxy-L-arabinose transferase-like glycosyltransferase
MTWNRPFERLPRGVSGYLTLLLFGLLLWLPGFAALPTIDRDEARYAQATKQMLETGNFIDIRFQEEPRYKKPIGIYWLQAAAVTLTGGPEPGRIWPYRLPSLLGGLVSLLLTLALGDRLFGRPVGFIAGLLLAAAPLLGIEVRMATTDAALLACCLTALWALAGIRLRRDQLHGVAQPWRWRWGEPMLLWAALGLGILIKGPIVLLVVGGTIGGLLLAERRFRWLMDLRPFAGMLLALAIALPWFVLIVRASGGAFFERAVGQDFLGKLIGVQESHFGPPGYYLVLFWLTFWPASLVAALAAPAIWRERRSDPVRFCLAWLIPTWLVFELALTKLPHYVLPLYPAVAILAAAGLVQPVSASGGSWSAAARWTVAAVWAAIGLAIASLGVLVPRALGVAVDPLAWALLGVVAALVGGVLLAWQGGRERRALALLLPLATLPPLFLFGRMLPALDPVWLSREVARAVATEQPCPATAVAAVGYQEPSLVFALGTDTALVGVDEAAARLAADPACSLALVPEGQAPAFLKRLAAASLEARPVAAIAGFDYNKLHAERLTLYAAD